VSSTRWRFAGGPMCYSASRFCLAASAAVVVHTFNSHCLAHTSFGAEQSSGVSWINDLRRCTSTHQLRRDKADIKRHPAADMLRGGPTDKPGKCLPVSTTYELKGTHRELKSDTHWWNWLCFQQAYIEAFNWRVHSSDALYAYRIPALVASRSLTIKGMIVGRGQLASALSRCRYTRHTCSLHDETRLEYRPHFVLTICQCKPSACFTRRVRLLLIIITLGGDRIRWYASAVNEYSPIYDIGISL